MANVRGMSATNSVASQDRVVDMAKDVILLEPDKNQMVKFVSDLKKEVTINPEFHHQTDQIVQFIDQVSGAVADAADDTIPVDNGDRWLPNDVILVTSGASVGEVMRVLSVSSNTLTVTRQLVAGTGDSMADNDYLLKVSSAWGEGSGVRDSSGTALSLQTTKVDNYNYAQVEKTVVSLTNSQEAYSSAGGHYSGDARKYDQARAGMEHAKKMNQTCYFGKRYASGNLRLTGGFIEAITRTASTSSLTHANIDTDVNTFMRYGSNKKKLFTTRRVSGKISKIAADKIVVNDGAGHTGGGDIDKGATYGARVRTFIADGGEFDIIVDDTLGDVTAFLGYGLFIDPADIAYRFAPGRDTKLHLDAQLPGEDGKTDYYLTEWGIQRGNTAYHGMWTSVAA